jgi:hypothetical protein
VPVASNASGQLAVQSPKIEKVPNDFDVEGDLTVTGTATIAVDATVNTLTVGRGGGSVEYNTAVGLDALLNNTVGTGNTAIGVNALLNNTEGIRNIAVGNSALSSNSVGERNTALGDGALINNVTGIRNTAVGQNAGRFIEGDNNTILGAYLGDEGDVTLSDTVIISAGTKERMRIDSQGVATFKGDVVVSSRNKQWMLVEQGGLCHMVEQVSATTADLIDPAFSAAEYPKLRDVFAELNLIEKALQEVMQKLRMTEPDGWPVWDGSDNSR